MWTRNARPPRAFAETPVTTLATMAQQRRTFAIPDAVPPRAAFLLLVSNEEAARALAHAIDGAVHLPAWDVPPLAGREPSAASQGRRLAALGAIHRAKRPRIVCGPEAVALAVPDTALLERSVALAPGTAFGDLEARLRGIGYRADDRADAPGRLASAGAALDLWPADRDAPIRVRAANGTVETMVAVDPTTLRGGERIDDLLVPPAATHCDPDEGKPGEAESWPAAWERRTVLDLVGRARVLMTPEVAGCVAGLIEEADRERDALREEGDGTLGRRAWLDRAEWDAIAARAREIELDALPPFRPASPMGDPAAEELLSVGDRVVHPAHGLGLFRGIETMEVDGHARDVLQVEFADGTLGVPAAEAGTIWRHSGAGEHDDAEDEDEDRDDGAGGGPRLDRMGGEAWAKAAAALARELHDTVDDLRAAREALDQKRAPRIAWSGPLLARVAKGWHEPTADQHAAMRAIAADMGGEPEGDTERDGDGVRPPMERLLCGDVGTGKTEAILRAALATVEAGHQALVAAPTVLLAAQHAATFRERLDPLGVTVRALDGATPDAEAEDTLKCLRDGDPMIVVGTHRLAGEDVAPARPGLLVLDEEQRFGAGLKADLRARMAGAHVLATTATPIPRTQMAALAGLRSVSTLRLPPPGRGTRRTEARDWDERVLARALEGERQRGGRAYVVVPRIGDMEAVADGLARIVPGHRVARLHGRMDEGEATDALARFRSGEADVLLATSVVETGIDVPDASLIAILGAGSFGLAQLHQLRGRVGRGARGGRALLFAECGWTEARASAATRARLDLMERHDGPGAGFALAARDLEQRGSGELFGERQTGHLKRLGAPLYARLLRDVMAGGADIDALGDPAALVLPGAILPADHVPHPDVRARLYVRLARAADANEVDALAEEIADRFGLLPEPAARFVAASRLSARARKAGVREIATGPEAVALDLAPTVAATLRQRIGGKAVRWRDDRLVFRSCKPEPDRTRLAIEAIERAIAEAGATGDDEATREAA